MTVTLQNVTVPLMLCINGPAITGIDDTDWIVEFERLLGRETPLTSLRGGAFKLTWLCEQFSVDSLIDVQAQQHARGHILHMINTTLFSDYSTNNIYLR